MVHLELTDSGLQHNKHRYLCFVLYEKNRNTWHNNMGKNFHVDLSLAKFRLRSKETELTIEKEIAEFLEYQEHHRLRTKDFEEYYMSLTPEKVEEHLRFLVDRAFFD